jgi:ubiquinone/menaquinone biosynthesis C-methylase UbiE
MDHIERTRREFGQQAANFAASTAINDEDHVRRLVDPIGVAAQGRVLDVACGPGIVTVELARTARDVVALDLTPEMLNKARERCGKAARANVCFEEGTASALPFDDASFDAVVTRLSFHHFTEPRTVLAEMHRVLKPSGLLAVADIVTAEDREPAELQNAIEQLRDPSHVRMLPASELRALVIAQRLSIQHDDTWDKVREFEEWVGIVANPERIAPLRTVVRSLARAGVDAGMGLTLRDGAVHFFHRWQVLVARKH